MEPAGTEINPAGICLQENRKQKLAGMRLPARIRKEIRIMTSFTFIVKDPMGIHARPAGLLAKEAAKYASKITLKKGDKSGDAKRIFNIMGLNVKTGDTIEVTVEGESEQEDKAALEAFIRENEAFE